ncbi:NADP-dependent oxidoreductase [Flavobacterium aquidurense]|uniref:Alcohol dehydrogenase zinc-binding domain protein n=1 Tax=Flavobacterium aquidurense TaxID=362413 RepID=A0A0Q1BNS7_9FLAO|nr:NADP-dependent oxidoreductase [Flavobacterium aquidurense]KQB42527.1 Alcohol dehydrogenase zinc-binding domain protein [Flavobacterium aquidurense]
MKAFIINKYTKRALEIADVPTPVVGNNDVLIEVYSAGVNLLDSKVKKGEFKLILPYKLPMILGHDVAGIITEVGKNVKKFKVGDKVYSRPADYHVGTFAEYIAINEKDVAFKPKNISMNEAASIPLVALTAWQALVERVDLKKGQKVFIQAGSGGVGTVAIQLAKYLGALVATTASDKSFEFLKNLGADVLIDYKTHDFEHILKDYDVVVNSQDQKTLEKSLNILKPDGKIISISGPPTHEFAKEMGLPWYIRMITTLLSFSTRSKAEKKQVKFSFLFMRAEGSQLQEITNLIEAEVIKPVVDKVFVFEQTNDALQYVESGRAKGKVVIQIKSEK